MQSMMLAKDYDPKKHSVLGWFASPKLDGVRCFWDGGVTRGQRVSTLPCANMLKDKNDYIATGLWTRNWKPFFAPSWFIDQLPERVCLDGELYLGNDKFQETMSIVTKDIPDFRWKDIKLAVFAQPPYHVIFEPRKFSVAGSTKDTKMEIKPNIYVNLEFKPLRTLDTPVAYLIEQRRVINMKDVDKYYNEILSDGGEGLMFKQFEQMYVNDRTSCLLKYKPKYEEEGVVVGEVMSDKLRGMIKSVIVEWRGLKFKVCGFPFSMRAPGTFPLGSVLPFWYRCLTEDGTPREARFNKEGHNNEKVDDE